MTQKPRSKQSFWRVFAPVCAAVVLVAGSLWAGSAQPGLNCVSAPAVRSAAKETAGSSMSRSSQQDSIAGALYSVSSEEAVSEYAVMDTAANGLDAGSGWPLRRKASESSCAPPISPFAQRILTRIASA